MSEKLITFTNSKLVMARSMLRMQEKEAGADKEAARQAFLFHLYGTVNGLLGEILEASLIPTGKPVTLPEAEIILSEQNILSGGVQQIKSLAEHGWLSTVFYDFQRSQEDIEPDSIEGVAVERLIASSAHSTSVGCRGREEEVLNAMTELVQDIRGQLQEW
ncbi:DUF6586 family protein [Sansalvadorimonas verongulae]|uniref:DUF6586 family protein n=1 Tax=Sansalvadorimonas verongulae TaxID=2172824 RepID=UPI0012BD14DE|nr:DUF6586 family protein [Sansalvadorimonas verongulae]MTI14316.1 hypothetical protein [Sansalvadorimonas verongulae]